MSALLGNNLSIAAFATMPSPPPGMLYVQEGQFHLGRDDSNRPDETPRHLVKVSAFYMDETLVTTTAFEKFVMRTHYVTTAEKRGYGMVAIEKMKDWQWQKTKNADWRIPFGSTFAGTTLIRADDPVVQVSWIDADAYCRAEGKRLPTEAEWEYVARAGRNDSRFPWGDQSIRPDGRVGLNFWQGKTHEKSDSTDGYTYVSPVKAFPPNDWGMYDPVGNVWQWTNDWYSATTYAKDSRPGGVLNPQGPKRGTEKVGRGGSWWCSEGTCHGFGLWYRGKNRPDAAFNNNGFRCAKDLFEAILPD